MERIGSKEHPLLTLLPPPCHGPQPSKALHRDHCQNGTSHSRWLAWAGQPSTGLSLSLHVPVLTPPSPPPLTLSPRKRGSARKPLLT